MACHSEKISSKQLLTSESQGFELVFERHVYASGLKVYISKGNLIHQRTEAIVSPTYSDLNCSRGASKIIAKAAGIKLIEECRKYKETKKGLPLTEVMHTASGNLEPDIKYVIHAAGPSALDLMANQTLEQPHPLMVKTFLNCFDYANDKLCVSSIAVPAIGAGNHDVPIEIVGSAMFKAVEIFDKEQKSKILKTIHFVNIDEPTARNICKAFKEWNNGRFSNRCEGHSSNIQKLNINFPHKMNGTSNGHSYQDMTFFENSASNDKERDVKKIFTRQDSTDQRKCCGGVMTAASRSSSENPARKLRNELGDEKQFISKRNSSSSSHVCQDIQMEVDVDLTSFQGNPESEFKNEISSNRRTRCESGPSKSEEKDVCAICMDEIVRPKKLKCGHVFCKDCLKEYDRRCNPKCPTCGAIYGNMRGNQPPGTLCVAKRESSLSGHEGHGTLTISFDIPDGIQNETHPNPGTPFIGTRRTAYLPDDKEGRQVAKMLMKAFDHNMLFTVGRSHTTGRENVIVWNDIHLKTSIAGTYGYPDPGYLRRVKEELAAKGIHP